MQSSVFYAWYGRGSPDSAAVSTSKDMAGLQSGFEQEKVHKALPLPENVQGVNGCWRPDTFSMLQPLVNVNILVNNL